MSDYNPMNDSANAEAKARWLGSQRYQDSIGSISGELEIQWLWEELAQMTTAHNWAIEETHQLGKQLGAAQQDRDLWKMEAEASANALRELRSLMPQDIIGS